MNRLQDRVALVTGGGAGLGKAIVARFLAEGARVAVLERSGERAAALRKEFPSGVVVIEGDVRSFEDNVRTVEAAVKEFGKLDVLVGNAGIWDYFASLVDLPGANMGTVFDEIFQINVLGYLMGAKAAMAELVKNRGSVILTVSNSGFHPGGGGPIYVSSKHAVVGLIRQLAHELAPHVRVNGVSPGVIPSQLSGPRSLDLHDRALSDLPLEELMRNNLPIDRIPTPDEYTPYYVLLASQTEAVTMTGEIIRCDGGFSARGMRSAAGGADLPQKLGINS